MSRIHELPPEELAIYRRLDPKRLPKHVAIIMDGNGRWAGKRRLKRFLGHQQGAEAVHFVVETASRIDLPWLTLYAFSLENNLRRPKTEVNFLMRLLSAYLTNNVQRMNDNNVRIRYIGRTHDLPAEVQDKMQWAAEETRRNTGTTLTLALNYGARSELVDAFKRLHAEIRQKHIRFDDITEQDIQRHLYTVGQVVQEQRLTEIAVAARAKRPFSIGTDLQPSSEIARLAGGGNGSGIEFLPRAEFTGANAFACCVYCENLAVDRHAGAKDVECVRHYANVRAQRRLDLIPHLG